MLATFTVDLVGESGAESQPQMSDACSDKSETLRRTAHHAQTEYRIAPLHRITKSPARQWILRCTHCCTPVHTRLKASVALSKVCCHRLFSSLLLDGTVLRQVFDALCAHLGPDPVRPEAARRRYSYYYYYYYYYYSYYYHDTSYRCYYYYYNYYCISLSVRPRGGTQQVTVRLRPDWAPRPGARQAVP